MLFQVVTPYHCILFISVAELCFMWYVHQWCIFPVYFR